MWVKLPTQRYRAVLRSVIMDEPIYEALQTEVRQTSKTIFQINAPYAAWKFAQRQMYLASIGPRGGKKPYGEKANFQALQTITKELTYVDTHPAMQGCAMFGLHSDVFPAWKLTVEEHSRLYSPYPQPGHQFVVLTPTWQEHRDRPTLTWWVERPSAEDRLAHESAHLPLWRREI